MRITRQRRFVGSYNVLAGIERALDAVGRWLHAAESFHDYFAIAIHYIPNVGREEMMVNLLRSSIEVAHCDAHNFERFRVRGELLIHPISDRAKSEQRNSDLFL